ncbi:MAG: DUF1002 domain-containing protein [Aerococcaceae bacterium]|nr:DUF1002 domain-containing protein [Aerococcaceae bacterium]
MKIFLSLCTLLTLCLGFVINPVLAEEVSLQKVTLGVSLSPEQRNETLDILGSSNIMSKDILTIDGSMVNKYLKDGSNLDTDIYSSAYIELKPEGYGVQVQILTPDNITSVSKTTYQSAAITAGARNVLIKIASVQKVTGEGALTGLYEAFSSAGLGLNDIAIKVAETQLVLEQKLVELTELSSEEVSNLVNTLNVRIIEIVTQNKEFNENIARELVENLLLEKGYTFSKEIIELLVNHSVLYSNSPSAKDASTKKIIETSLSKTIIGEQYSNGNIDVVIDDIYFTDERERYSNQQFENVLVISYTLKNKASVEYYTGHEFQAYINGHKAEEYYIASNKMGPVSSGRTISVSSSYGFNGPKENIELELKDLMNWDGEPTIIPVENIRDIKEDVVNENPSSSLDSFDTAETGFENLELVEVTEDRLLTKPGEYTKDAVMGTLTLLKIKDFGNQIYEIAPGVEVVIKTVKLFDVKDVPADSTELYMSDLGISREGGRYIQYEYTINNKTDQKITNAFFNKIIYSDGEQVNDNQLTMGEPVEIEGNAKVSNVFALSRASNTNIKGLKLYMDLVEFETQPIELKFD